MTFDSEFLIFAVIGFLAQLVDGAVGMAFGIIASSSLIFLGAGPAVASASVHAAEIVTTGVSGLSHIFNRNFARRIFLPLALAGSAGGVIGAYFLSELPEEIIKPFVTLYLFLHGAADHGAGLRIFAREDQRAAGGSWRQRRFSGCRRRWWVGTAGCVQPRCQRGLAASFHRLRHRRRVLCHHRGVDDFLG